MENLSGITIKKGQPIANAAIGIQLANSSNAKYCIGLAYEDIANNMSGNIVDDDTIELTDWTEVIGLISLTKNQLYWLDSTDGRLTSSPPSTGYSQIIGKALSAKILQININESIKL